MQAQLCQECKHIHCLNWRKAKVQHQAQNMVNAYQQAIVPMARSVRFQGLPHSTIHKAQEVVILSQVGVWPVCWEAVKTCRAQLGINIVIKYMLRHEVQCACGTHWPPSVA